jgi:hypothetical protein
MIVAHLYPADGLPIEMGVVASRLMLIAIDQFPRPQQTQWIFGECGIAAGRQLAAIGLDFRRPAI